MNKAVITLRGFNDIFSDESRSFIIGKKIEKIRFNEDYLVLEFEDTVFAVSVEGDCCSTSYFYDFYGVDKILNCVIEDIDSIELDPTDLKASHNGDCVKVYGYRIVCKEGANKNGWPGSRKTGVFSFRNDSNGYYGGSVCPVPSNFDYTKVPEIKDDVLGL